MYNTYYYFFYYLCRHKIDTFLISKLMRVIIESDYQKMSQWAAEHVIERINAFKPTAEKPFLNKN